MTHKERLKQIDKYFENISIEEFEKQLEECGFGEIKSCKESGYELIEIKENQM